jgi:hypothetical protein
MKIITEYRIYFLVGNTAPFSQGQQVLGRNQNPDLRMPAAFDSEDEALAWVEGNDTAMSRAGEFVILPVHRVSY